MTKWRGLGPALAVLGAALLATSAQAQISPFRNSRNSPKLNAEDTRMLDDSLGRLNGASDVHAGQSDRWSNPQTGSSGTSTIERVFRSGDMPCHAVRLAVSARGRKRPVSYNLTYCRTPGGEWKIRS